jgi:hypothetical protein
MKQQYAGGISLVFSRANQAWLVMWCDQVLRIFNDRPDAEAYIASIGANTEGGKR